MLAKDQRQFWHNPNLNIGLMHAFHVDYVYPRHSHDEYVICIIERGVQSFTHKGTKYVTPSSGLILINPGVVHTGEAVTEHGFQMRCLYPTMAHMEMAVYELTGRQQAVPFFREVRIDDLAMTSNLLALHNAIISDGSALEYESRFITTLSKLIEHYGEIRPSAQPLGNERFAVQKARRYIETHFAESIRLETLAAHVVLSPFYFLRVFREEVGMPPHAYLQDVRIRRARQLIEHGRPLAEVALEVGFSHQSHLNRRFKQVVGITPGRYAQQVQQH